MRVLIIDPDEARAALVAEGLGDVRPLAVRRAASLGEAEPELGAFAPDVIVVACEILRMLRASAPEISLADA